MKSNYKKIGDFIELVDVRNKDLSIDLLLGLSVTKEFISSVANTIGTNMKNYKIIRKGQFACSVMQVRRDKKMPVALLQDFDEAIISQAYPVFQIKDETQLIPEYLMMWFTRSEFDREACFHAVGGVRGSLEWEDFLNMELPVPSIEKQQEIVKEYNTVVKHIKLNEQINEKLEETAQALYKHWFVDFNFPITKESCPELVSGSPELEGKPYKSSGGEMVYNEELDGEIPLGWGVSLIYNFIEDTLGGDWGKDKPIGNYIKKVRCVRGTDIPLLKRGNLIKAPIRYILEKNLKNREILKDQIVIEISGGSPTQSTGRSVLVTENHLKFLNEKIICSNFCRTLKLKNVLYSKFLFSHIDYLYSIDYLFSFENSTTGVKNFNINSFLEEEYLIVPSEQTLKLFNSHFDIIITHQILNQKEICELEKINNLLLSKMTKIGV
ncbi:restriction endonuclease subunit S [uncultured Polaribacter sp.]|uniref:restriction endonuclease subunit S n=1 Tax=uncultured Polaribacter sp. TaxID=174711 RepID=UPI00262C12A3|nr:restriction endonuclease subunit S [uncultured Polaribacter sp.]